MRSEAEIKAALDSLEYKANQFEDVYEESFVAIKALRWILDLPAPIDYRRRDED